MESVKESHLYALKAKEKLAKRQEHRQRIRDGRFK